MSVNAYIQIKSCDGESTQQDHVNWIEIVSWNWGVEHPSKDGEASTAVGERVVHRPFCFTQRVDSGLVKLLRACCLRSRLPSATVDLLRITGKDTGEVYLRFVLKDVVARRVLFNQGSPAETPAAGIDSVHAAVELTYSSIEWTYTTLDPRTGKPGGNVTGAHNLQSNQVS